MAGGHQDGIGPLNLSAVLAFVAWFGGVGYLARHGLGLGAPLSALAGVAAGVAIGAAVWWLVGKILGPNDRALDPEDYRLPGTLARVTSTIRNGGTGEVVYEQGGVRQVSAARAVDGAALPRGTEVVILECAHGIALVEPWSSFLGDRHAELAGGLDPPAGAQSERVSAA